MADTDSDGEAPFEDEGDWSSGDEAEEEKAMCLFCHDVLKSKHNAAECVFLHCKEMHGVDLLQLLPSVLTDEFSYFKLINYLRKHEPPVQEFLSFVASPGVAGKLDDAYLQPVDPTDCLLFHDIAQLLPNQRGMFEESASNHDGQALAQGDSCGVGLRGGDRWLLEQRASTAEGLAAHLQETVTRLQEDMEKMRAAAQSLILSAGGPVPVQSCSVASLTPDEDDAYVSSYSHFSIHQEMLQDQARTESYRKAMLGNSHLFKGKTVLDVGCGTGVLSMFAAQAGAAAVYGVDMSDIIYTAMDIVRENEMENVITLIRGRIEDVSLPVKQVDIIVSEWMGYCLLFESMLDSVLFARDKWLAPGGIVLPNRCTMHIAAVEDPDLYQRHVGFWSDVYGFRMSSMRTLLLKEAAVAVVPNGMLCTQAVMIRELDCQSCRLTDLEFTSEFTLHPKASSAIHAFVCYFDAHFDGNNYFTKVVLSTSPSEQSTHWKQTVLMLPVPLLVDEGGSVTGKFSCQKNNKDPRSLILYLAVGGTCHKYLLS